MGRLLTYMSNIHTIATKLAEFSAKSAPLAQAKAITTCHEPHPV